METQGSMGHFPRPFSTSMSFYPLPSASCFLLFFVFHVQYSYRRTAEWTAYFLLLFFIPITAMIIITCGNPTDYAKLFVRPYYSSMAIWALVYVVWGEQVPCGLRSWGKSW